MDLASFSQIDEIFQFTREEPSEYYGIVQLRVGARESTELP